MIYSHPIRELHGASQEMRREDYRGLLAPQFAEQLLEPVDTQQTLAFHRVLEHAVSHCEGAEKEQVDAGDILAAIFQEPDSFAVTALRAGRLAVLPTETVYGLGATFEQSSSTCMTRSLWVMMFAKMKSGGAIVY